MPTWAKNSCQVWGFRESPYPNHPCAVADILTKPDCAQVIEAADKAIADLQLDITAKNRVIDTQAAQLQAQAELLEDTKAWYHNPFVTGSLGLAVGVLAGVFVSKGVK